MATVPEALSGVVSVADVAQDAPSGIHVGRGIGDPDSGDGFAGGLGQVSEPIRTGRGQLAGVGEQDVDVTIGLVPASTSRTESGQDGITVLPGRVDGAQMAR